MNELHRHLTGSMGDKAYMLSMLRHLNEDHRYFKKSYKSKERAKHNATQIDRQKKEVLQKYQNAVEDMPRLKGSNPKAKTKIYTNMTKSKKPTRAEREQRGENFQRRMANDERASEMTEQV